MEAGSERIISNNDTHDKDSMRSRTDKHFTNTAHLQKQDAKCKI